MKLIQRNNDIGQLKYLLEKFSIVVLYGPRQIGKTTIAKQLNPDYYFSLDFLDIKGTIIDKIDSLNGLVVIDEIQNNLEVIQKIKQIIDSRENIKFLILGSASNIVVKTTRQQLIGRAVFYELQGLKLSDIDFDINSHFLKGGYPFSFLSDETSSFKYRLDYLSGAIFREVAESGLRLSPHLIQRLLKILADTSGNIFNKTNASYELSVSRNTIETYLSFFEQMSFIRIVPNINIHKNPKFYIRDSGLLNCLNNIETIKDLLSSSRLNQIWESYILEALINEFNIKEINHYAVIDHHNDIDFIIYYRSKKYGIYSNYSGKNNKFEKYTDVVSKLNLDYLLFVNNNNINEPINNNIISISLNNIPSLFNDNSKSVVKTEKPKTLVSIDKARIFISYSHKDSDFVIDLKNKLEQENIGIYIDIEKLKFGDNIKDFISETVRITEFTVQIISINSLRSPYVLIEYLETQLYEDAEQSKRYIPIFIDKSVFDDDTYIELADDIQKEIDQVNEYIQKAILRNLHAGLYNSKRDRLIDLKNSLGKAIDRLRDSLLGDFTNKKSFDKNIKKLIEALIK